MKLSVVIPVYNGADFIEKSYHSILNQQLDHFEILYVDNNSQDASVTQINQLVALDSRVKLLKQSKQGAAAARNMGIKHAEGDYVYVFDVDDEIYPHALQKMVAVLDTYPYIDAVFGKMVKSYQGILNTVKPNDETHEVILRDTPYWGLQWFSSLKAVVGPPAFLYRKSIFDRIGFYNESIRNNEDTALEQGTPLRFKSLLFSQLFQSMGRQVVFTKGLKNRQELKQQLYHDVHAIRIPLVIRLYLSILVILPLESLRKVYGYYVVPYAVKQLLKKHSEH